MKVLLVGNGGRESALAWKIAQSSKLTHLYVSPGNAGTHQFGLNLNYKDFEIEKLLNFAINNQIDLTVIGPEIPLDLNAAKNAPVWTGSILFSSYEFIK